MTWIAVIIPCGCFQKAFNKQYYDADMDDEKPTWSDDEELGLQGTMTISSVIVN